MRFFFWAIKFVTICLMFLSVSCIEDDDKNIEPDPNPLTLIFYMAGDDNQLSGETFDKIETIADLNLIALESSKANILIYQDVLAGDGEPVLWRVKYSSEGTVKSVPLSQKPTLERVKTYSSPRNSASKGSFVEVLNDCFSEAPAQKYGLWFFSHGSGWLPEGKLNSPSRRGTSSAGSRSVGADGTNELELSDFAEALPDGKFEFIVFEMCLTGGIEVAYELKDKAKYLWVSSARMVSPGMKNVYRKVIPQLFIKGSDMKITLKNTAMEYFSHWNSKGGAERSATVSLIDTQALAEVAVAARDIYSNGNSVSDLDNLQIFEKSNYKLFFDFGQYMNELAIDSDQRLRFNDAISKAVIYKAATPYYFEGYPTISFQINHHSGLTVYIPQVVYPDLNDSYCNTAWWQATH